MQPKTTNSPAYTAIVAKAAELSLPKAFSTDLTKWDREWIAANPGVPFFWGPYRDGTHLSHPKDPRRVDAGVVSFVRENSGACFWWDGVALLDFALACRRAEEGFLNAA